MSADLLSDATANLAGWHDASLRALGLRCETGPVLWQCSDPAPMIFFAGVTLGGEQAKGEQLAAIEALVQSRPHDEFAVCDAYGVLDLDPLGMDEIRRGEWMVRQPGEPQRRPFPADFAIERVVNDRQLAAWEAASAMGFSAPHPPQPGTWHAPGILADPRIQVFAGRVDGKVVAGSMAYLSERVNGVYGVSTIPGFRKRGYAEWLTWRTVLARPHQPAILQPSDHARGLYEHMGFRPAGDYAVWRYRPGNDRENNS